MKTKYETETIAEIRCGGRLGDDPYVARVFRTRQNAHKYENGLYENVSIMVLAGKFRTGQKLPRGTERHTLSSEYGVG